MSISDTTFERNIAKIYKLSYLHLSDIPVNGGLVGTTVVTRIVTSV